MLSRFSRVQLFAILWTVARQAPLSMGFSRQELLEWVAIPFSRFVLSCLRIVSDQKIFLWLFGSFKVITKTRICLTNDSKN